ncbi:MAG: hypothetical protein FWG50_08935 [Kiritimatiellaeota bacterium]|nr:hypothetical protein [Kiritimatiellota bacterium]
MVAFRNIDVAPDAPVAEWGFEGMLCALERGDLADWQRLYAACADENAAPLRQTLSQALCVLERGDIRPQLAVVFRGALNPEREAVCETTQCTTASGAAIC